MTFSEAVRSGFDHYTKFDGRASRSAFWWWVLFQIIALAIAAILDSAIFESLSVFYALTSLALLLPSLSVGIRRLHDTGRTGWWILLSFIPILGPIVLLVFFLTGSDGPNQYGPGPDTDEPGTAAAPPPPAAES